MKDQDCMFYDNTNTYENVAFGVLAAVQLYLLVMVIYNIRIIYLQKQLNKRFNPNYLYVINIFFIINILIRLSNYGISYLLDNSRPPCTYKSKIPEPECPSIYRLAFSYQFLQELNIVIFVIIFSIVTNIWVNIYISYLQVNSQYSENDKGFIFIKVVLLTVPALLLASMFIFPFVKLGNNQFNHYIGFVGAMIQIIFIFGNLAFMVTKINKFYYLSNQLMKNLKILMWTLIFGCLYRLAFNIIAISSDKILQDIKNYKVDSQNVITQCEDQGPYWAINTFLLYFFGDSLPNFILILLFNPKAAKE